jgi:hypothetical protein
MISYLPSTGPYGIEVGVMLIGGSMILTWGKSMRLGRASLRWPRARGTIVSSELEGYPIESFRLGARIRVPAVEYEFWVGEMRYTGSRIGAAGSIGISADNTVHAYRKGDKVDVSYDPADPRRAMLRPGIYHDGYTFICIGAFLIACGAVAMLLGWGSVG